MKFLLERVGRALCNWKIKKELVKMNHKPSLVSAKHFSDENPGWFQWKLQHVCFCQNFNKIFYNLDGTGFDLQ